MPEEAPAAAYDGRRFFLILQGLHQLDDCHLSSISPAGAGAGHSGVAAVAVSVLRSDLLEQLVGNVFLGDERQRLTVSCQVALLAQIGGGIEPNGAVCRFGDDSAVAVRPVCNVSGT